MVTSSVSTQWPGGAVVGNPAETSFVKQSRSAADEMARTPMQVTLPVDSDILAWFCKSGSNWKDQIRKALRQYAEQETAAY